MSQDLPRDSLTVSWTMSQPAALAKRWHDWTGKESFPLRPLERQLGWPDGTISALEEGFRLGLSRSVGWNIKGHKQSEALQKAASIFRRGVPYSEQETIVLSGHYEIRIREDNPLSEILAGQRPLIIDQQLAKAWNIPQGPQFRFLSLDERQKTLDTVAMLVEWLEGQSSGTIDIIGGGLIADTAAFAAALAGRPFRLIPTTLLSMLDACIGGKTGVNFPPFGKNQVGLFAFPEEVLVSIRWLESLPPREIQAGLAEGFKHALISGDKSLAEKISAFVPGQDSIRPFLQSLIQVKADIVAQDPAEQGLRATLNLGHTLAHAIERVAHMRKSDLLHGEAVSVGLLFMLEMSREFAGLSMGDYQEMRSLLLNSRFLLSRKSLEEKLTTDDLESLSNAMVEGISQDKKNDAGGSSEWVLLKGWGQPLQNQERFTTPIPHSEFRRMYTDFLARWPA